MGSSQNKKSGMVLDFERQHYYPGEVIKGNIYLNLKDNFETQGIEMTLTTEQYVSFYEHEYVNMRHVSHHNNRSVTKSKQERLKSLREGKNILFKYSTIIGSINNSFLNKGQYIYPFSFILPNSVPGSFEYYDHENSAYIRHILSARLISNNQSVKELSTANVIIVRQQPQNFNYPPTLSDTKSINTFCCFSKGISILNVGCAKNNYSPDEVVQVNCELNNIGCKANGTCIKLQLFQRITLKDLNGRIKVLNRRVCGHRYEGFYVLYIFNYSLLDKVISILLI